jgi:predicted PurR-regulated permease PerM
MESPSIYALWRSLRDAAAPILVGTRLAFRVLVSARAEPEPVAPRSERTTLRVLLVLFVAGSIALLLPFWPSLLLALWTSYLTKPLVARLTHWIGGRRRAAALVMVGLLIAALVPAAAGIAVVAPDAIELGQRAVASKSGQGAVLELVSGNPESSDPRAQIDKVVQMMQTHGKEAWSVAALLAGATGRVVLGFLIYLVATFGAMVQGSEAYLWLRARMPLAARDLDRLRDAFQETGRGLLYSVALTALLIAAVATIAYAALGLPRVAALGLATLIASLIPAVGPFLVWGPVSLGLLLAGHPIKAALLAGICIIVIAPIDHFVRPYLAQRGKLQLNSLLVFLSMFGGVVCVGGFGLMLGPLVFRITFELLAIVRERDDARVADVTRVRESARVRSERR